MKLIAHVSASCALATVGGLLAQTDPQVTRSVPVARDTAQCHYLKASEIVGTNVHNAVATENQKGDKVGDVKDIILATHSTPGHSALLVVSDGELFSLGNDPHHGVCCLKWDGRTRVFGVDTASTTVRGDATRGVDEAVAARGDRMAKDARGSADAAMTPKRLMMWSGLKGMKVCAQGAKDSCGKVDDIWIDATHGCTGYLVVSTGGVLGVGDTLRLVPWSAASIERAMDDKANRVTLRATKETLESAPKVESKSDANDPALLAQACKTFGCEEPNKSGVDPRRQPSREDGKRPEEGKR